MEKMIEKLAVRKQLALIEKDLKEKIKIASDAIEKMDNNCTTLAMERIWRNSVDYIKLQTRILTLREALVSVQDFRCGEILDDDK